jgi:2-iminobutanoate/2-iminopropanoate deaminase
MSERTPITAPAAPAAVGPYSQAIRHGDLIFCAGALPLDPGSGELVDGSLEGFAAITAAYGRFFPSAPPARAAVGVVALPRGARVEIDAIVAVG